VRVNGVVVTDPSSPVRAADDDLEVDGHAVPRRPPAYLMLNKPRGLVTTARDERGRPTVYACLPAGESGWLAPVGRLDKASEGLLLFTNDTVWSARLLAPASHLPRVYHVQVDRVPNGVLCRRVEAGVVLEGRRLAAHAARVLRTGDRYGWLEVTLTEGRNRHIRRLLQTLGVGVRRLVRVGLGPLVLGDLARGASRYLTAGELEAVASALTAVGGLARPGERPASRPRAGRPSPGRRAARRS
jgi:23S rRNA pseudouridine2605 synthase